MWRTSPEMSVIERGGEGRSSDDNIWLFMIHLCNKDNDNHFHPKALLIRTVILTQTQFLFLRKLKVTTISNLGLLILNSLLLLNNHLIITGVDSNSQLKIVYILKNGFSHTTILIFCKLKQLQFFSTNEFWW